MEVRNKKILKWLNRMNADSNNRGKWKYCHFHCDHGHTTADCFDLKDEIKSLICNGHLREYIYKKMDDQPDQMSEQQNNRNNEATVDIHIIFKGIAGGEDSNRAPRAHARSISSSEHHINLTNRALKEQKMVPCDLTFTEEDARGVHHPQTMP
ncbi:uncharacterized protein LOC131238822 [Magnolia sinica]|uniref:uncharacterized protein LOC131238822 n=1 Tax=Magnolia sinica TaxID=86752 RepID=UPI0026584CF5|nr:uncharacterized protein LOC131238822 [Magnolia sinica]